MADSPFKSWSVPHLDGGQVDPESIGDDYDPSLFMTRGSDMKGHSTSYRVTVPKHWARIVAMVTEAIPDYDTQAAFIRDAMFHRAVWILGHKDDPELRQLMRSSYLRARAAQEMEHQRQIVEYLNEMERGLNNLNGVRDKAGIGRLVANLREWAETEPDPYAGRALTLADQYDPAQN